MTIQDMLNEFTPDQLVYLKKLATKMTAAKPRRPSIFEDDEVASLLTQHFDAIAEQCQWLSLKDIIARVQIPLDKPRGNSIMRVNFKQGLRQWLEQMPQGFNTKQATTARAVVYYHMPPFADRNN